MTTSPHIGSHTARHRHDLTFLTVRNAIRRLLDVWRATKAYALVSRAWGHWRTLWAKRPQCSLLLYFTVSLALTVGAVLLLQWSVYQEPVYADDSSVDANTRASNSVAGRLTAFVSQVWLHHQYQFLLNCLIMAVLYLIAILAINRFWLATGVFGTVVAVFAVANKCKVLARNEPIVPADLSFLSGGNTGDVASFVPTQVASLVASAKYHVAWFIALCLLLYVLDRRKPLIRGTWRPSRATVRTVSATVCRLLACALSIAVAFSFVWGLSVPESWSQRFARKFSDNQMLWDAMADATANGPMVTFLRLAHTKVMDKPDGYNEETMRRLAARYGDEADSINRERSGDLTDSTVIMVLSESFSDPTRVPGVTLPIDPMPHIRAIENSTDSGLALSTGYGGGTANIEYQALTGLSMSEFSPSLSVAYQQLVPKQRSAFSFNQLWNDSGTADDAKSEAASQEASVAIHPYMRTMYFRSTNYAKFGFDEFLSLDGPNPMTCPAIDRSPYASDQCAYRYAVSQIDATTGDAQFLQVVTMQNHTPYDGWYDGNEFATADPPITDRYDQATLSTYAKGMQYTDAATADFLDQLDHIDKPITVVFYGDHAAGIYGTTGSADDTDTLGLHETDYFIWSNAATWNGTRRSEPRTAQYSSSNYFMAQTATHLNARVSPYLAFLTRMHEAVPAMSVPAAGSPDPHTPTYLDMDGTPISAAEMSDETLDLLRDYRLIQYDLTAGKHYLDGMDFMTLPE